MHLHLVIGTELIDALPVDPARLAEPGYLEALRREMEQQYEELLDKASGPIQFYVDRVPSCMSRKATGYEPLKHDGTVVHQDLS